MHANFGHDSERRQIESTKPGQKRRKKTATRLFVPMTSCTLLALQCISIKNICLYLLLVVEIKRQDKEKFKSTTN